MFSRSVVLYAVLLSLLASTAYGSKKVRRHVNGIKDTYIVGLPKDLARETTAEVARELTERYGGSVKTTWPDFRAFLWKGNDAQAELLIADPRVRAVEHDAVYLNPGVSAKQSTYVAGQHAWQLDRLDRLYYSAEGWYSMCPTGTGVIAYVFDYPVRTSHVEFTGQNIQTVEFTGEGTSNPPCPYFQNAWHGTAVASLLGGNNLGAARPTLISIKTIRCDGGVVVSNWIDALQWIVNRHRSTGQYYGRPALVNHSGFLPSWHAEPGGGGFAYKHEEFAAMVDFLPRNANIPYFTSANNYNTDACEFTPADLAYTRANRNTGSEGSVFVVGATNTSDQRWQESSPAIGAESGSNSGRCVSAFAPGFDILFGYGNGDTMYLRRNGTSFSAPLAAGLAARYMEERVVATGQIPNYKQVYDYLLDSGQVTPTNTATQGHYLCVWGNETGSFYSQPVDVGGNCPTPSSSQPWQKKWMPATTDDPDPLKRPRMILWNAASTSCP